MTNDGDLDIWALKWHDNGRPIEIYRYSGSVYKKYFGISQRKIAFQNWYTIWQTIVTTTSLTCTIYKYMQKSHDLASDQVY